MIILKIYYAILKLFLHNPTFASDNAMKQTTSYSTIRQASKNIEANEHLSETKVKI